MSVSLDTVASVDRDIETYLRTQGEIFRAFREQDSDCISYGVLVDGRRWFVKHSQTPRGMASLERAQHVYRAVQHPALPRLHNAFETPGGLAIVLDWLPGEVLNSPAYRGAARRAAPDSPHARFRALPARRIVDALDTIYDVHVRLAEHAFIAVDFYDGCILYDFDSAQTHVMDLDEYRPGPFILEGERLPGSRRFMAPEEFERGAAIDAVTNVFTLGRTAFVLLGDGTEAAESWRGNEAMRRVALQATAPERSERYQTVQAYVAAWRAACATEPCAS